ncbi:hypothetical protein KKC97_10980 [bacterium]|nr:hypothetical protein [bacterium]MBU1638176.1 hypothetical protein [bacterium]MBU1919534.1 hypothetical protein [bacterium]
MTDSSSKHPEGITPKKEKPSLTEAQLARQLRDTDLTKEEYDSLMEDLKKRRRRVEGSGDNLLDDVYGDEP